MSASFSDLSSFSFSDSFVHAVEAARGLGTTLMPEHALEMDKCIALFDQAPILYTLSRSFTTDDLESVNGVVDKMATLARTAKDSKFSQRAAALLQALAMKGYPLAQWEYARYLEKQEPHRSNHARLYYSLLMYNECAPKYMKDKVPTGMLLACNTPISESAESPASPLEEHWQNGEHLRWWKAARLDTITGVSSPAEFMSGKGDPVALPYVPELMLGTYNMPLTKCVEDKYLLDIYRTQEDREAFYKTVTNYKLPRLSWADRIALPVVGWLGKLGLAKDFISEGHRMCAVGDVVLTLLGKEIYQTDGKKKGISRPALALDTIKKMAKNGFPNAQIFLANYLRQQGLEHNNAQKVTSARAYAEQVINNPYAIGTETRWAKRLRNELTQEEMMFMQKSTDRRIKEAHRKEQQKNAQRTMTSKAKAPTKAPARKRAAGHQR